jgi:hypothetical protein
MRRFWVPALFLTGLLLAGSAIGGAWLVSSQRIMLVPALGMVSVVFVGILMCILLVLWLIWGLR